MFKPNIDTAGRLFRFAIAVILLIIAIVYTSWLVLLASAFVFFEAIQGWCVGCAMLGKSSCPIRKDKDKR